MQNPFPTKFLKKPEIRSQTPLTSQGFLLLVIDTSAQMVYDIRDNDDLIGTEFKYEFLDLQKSQINKVR